MLLKRDRYYQVHYAEMNSTLVKSLGILNICTAKSFTKKSLMEYAKEYLKMPNANIIISYIAKLNRRDFEEITLEKSM